MKLLEFPKLKEDQLTLPKVSTSLPILMMNKIILAISNMISNELSQLFSMRKEILCHKSTAKIK